MDSSRYGTISKTINKKAAKLQAKAKALESDIERLTEATKAEMIREKKAEMVRKLASLTCEKQQNSGGGVVLSTIASILQMLSQAGEALLMPIKLFVGLFD